MASNALLLTIWASVVIAVLLLLLELGRRRFVGVHLERDLRRSGRRERWLA